MGLMVLATTMEGVSGALGQRIPLQQKFPSRRCSEGLTASGEGLAVVLGAVAWTSAEPPGPENANAMLRLARKEERFTTT